MGNPLLQDALLFGGSPAGLLGHGSGHNPLGGMLSADKQAMNQNLGVLNEQGALMQKWRASMLGKAGMGDFNAAYGDINARLQAQIAEQKSFNLKTPGWGNIGNALGPNVRPSVSGFSNSDMSTLLKLLG